jgi:hypothetical protein
MQKEARKNQEETKNKDNPFYYFSFIKKSKSKKKERK